jgi:hydroxypyruvate reductase
MALQAAAAAARAAGFAPLILGDALEGESREMGTVLAGMARAVRRHGHPLPAPAVLLSGGESTVSIGAGPAGRGGRNTEFLLGLAVALDGLPGAWAIAGDTDGIDGTEDAAGAVVTPDTLARARAMGLDPRAVLAAHDSYGLFDALGDLVRTGPTLTNVNDVRAILVA